MVEVMIAIVFAVLPVAVIAGAISAAVAARRAADLEDPPTDEGIGSVRRLFIYALALVGVTFAAIGVSMIIGGTLDAIMGDVLLLERREGLAIALAFTVVGTPAWLLFMLLAQRSVAAHPVERRSDTRRLYFTLVRGIAITVVAWSAIDALQMLLGIEPFGGGPWGRTVAWAAVWAIHQRLALAEGPGTVMTRLIDRLGQYYGALLGLVILITGATGLIEAPLAETYDRLVQSSLVRGDWSRAMRESLVLLLVGLAIWGWHWLATLRRSDRLTTLWRVHVFLPGALLGVALVIAPGAAMLYTLLEWFVGTPGSDTAAVQFARFPATISAVVVGALSWAYHRAVLAEAGDAQERSGPERVYRYLLCAAGLVTTAVGVARLVALAAEAVSGTRRSLVVSPDWWRNPLLLALTLLVVGLPLWARFWRDTQRALADGLEERAAPSRRVYVFATVGVAIIALLVSLTTVLYQVFQALLAAELSMALVRDMRWGLGTAVATGVIAYYHFLVLREDQAALPAETVSPTPRRTRLVVLVAADGDDAVRSALDGIEGVRVRRWVRTDGTATAWPAERLAALRDAVAADEADRLLVVVTGDRFELVPYIEEIASR